jgi:hypothetical protein
VSVMLLGRFNELGDIFFSTLQQFSSSIRVPEVGRYRPSSNFLEGTNLDLIELHDMPPRYTNFIEVCPRRSISSN